MKVNNTCPNCSAVVEPGWDICWNCQNEIIPTPIVETDNSRTNGMVEANNLVSVDGQKIADAGKQIKMVVKLIVLTLIVALVTSIIESINNNPRIYIMGGMVNFIILILILFNLFQAGKDLEKSVDIKG